MENEENAAQQEGQDQADLAPGLYIIGTPIGNLADISLRALDTLRNVDAILAEDTRHSRRLLNRYDIRKRLLSCHKFNEAARFELIRRMIQDEACALALISDSGMPCVSDPGSRSVAACHAAGIAVTVVPGPSAVGSAVALSGLIEKGYVFDGFLSPKSAARRRRLLELDGMGLPFILFESPYRLLKLLTEIEELFPAREIYVGRELTKRFEESLRGTAGDVRAAFGERRVRGECVVVVAAACNRTATVYD